MGNYFINQAKKEIEDAKKKLDHAYAVTPEEYQSFIIPIKQNVKLGKYNKELAKNSETYDLGVWQNDKGDVYVSICKPYMSVDGRVKWARDDHRKEGKKLIFHEPKISNGHVSITIESELLGNATGTAKIGSGGGVDATNPIENAETSAIGRALGFLGYGLYGNGIASAEELMNETPSTQQPKQQKPKQPDQPKLTNVVEKLSGAIADYKVSGDYLCIILDTGEQVVFPVTYPTFATQMPQKGAEIVVNVVKRGNNTFVAGTTGEEMEYKTNTSDTEEIADAAIF